MAKQDLLLTKPKVYLKLSEPWHNRFYLLSIFWLLVSLLAIGQDIFNSSFNNSSFYLSESLLFNGFWLIFIPLTYGLFYSFSKWDVRLIHGSLYLNSIILSVILSILHLVLFSFLVFTISSLVFTHPFGFSWAIIETFSEDFYKNFLIYGLIIFLNLKNWLLDNDQKIAENHVNTNILSIREGKKLILINVSDIFWISAEHPYIAIHTEAKKHLYTSSLKQIQEKLNADQFIRVHRSTIINIKKVSELKSRLNGDYDVVLQNGIVLRMSRNFSQSVKDKLL